MKTGERHDAGGCSLDMTMISGFNLSRQCIIVSGWRVSTDYGQSIMMPYTNFSAHCPIADSQNSFQVVIMNEGNIASRRPLHRSC